MIRHRRTVVAALTVAVLLWLPLPFGSITPWGQLLAAALLLGAGGLALGLGSAPALARRSLPAASLAAVAVLGYFQALPLPLAFVAAVSPGHAELYGWSERILGRLGLGLEAAAHLSVAPQVSAWTATAWLAMAALFVAAVYAGRHHRPRRWLALALVIACGFQIVYALEAWLAGVETIWGFAVPRQPGRLRGTFVNPAHMAALLEVGLATVFAAGWVGLRRARRALTPERRLLWLFLPGALWVILFAGLTLTGSRASMLGALAGLGLQGLVVAAAEGRRRRSRSASAEREGGREGRLRALRRRLPLLLPATLAAFGVGLALWLSFGGGGIARLGNLSSGQVSFAARLETYTASIDLWQRFPIFGTGLGTFRQAFPLVQPSSVSGVEWWHTHCDPLEVLVTTGLVGFLVLAWGLIVLVRGLLRVWRPGGRTESRAAALAALGALTGLLTHGLVDFPLAMPAVAAALTVVCGAALGARPAADPPARGAQGSEAAADGDPGVPAYGERPETQAAEEESRARGDSVARLDPHRSGQHRAGAEGA